MGTNGAAAGGASLRTMVIVAVLLAMTWWVFAPVGGFEFINYDDDVYVTRNPLVNRGLSAEGLRGAFTTAPNDNWHPLTWLSHQFDATLFGPNPGGHHLMSVALHAGSGVLFFLLLRGLAGVSWPATFAAALFLVHPLHVESVAWIAERKDVLSGFFFMLTLLAWTRYVRGVYHPLLPLEGGCGVGVWPKDFGFVIHPPPTPPLEGGEQGIPGHDPRIFTLNRWYGVSLAFFAMGLMSKPMLVTLPFLLLLLDWWPLGRLAGDSGNPSRVSLRRGGWLLVEKAPFILLAAASSAATYLIQTRGGSVKDLAAYPPVARVGNAVLACVVYLRRTVWPDDLAIFYPHPVGTISAGALVAAVLVFAAVSLGVVFQRRRGYPLTGWCWYLGMLVPVIGLVQTGFQGMADRYTYLPLAGIFLAVSLGGFELVRRRPSLRGPVALAAVLAVVLAALAARGQVMTWRDDITLYRQALGVTRNNFVAHANLGMALISRNRLDEGLEHLYRSYLLRPDNMVVRFFLYKNRDRLGPLLERYGPPPAGDNLLYGVRPGRLP